MVLRAKMVSTRAFIVVATCIYLKRIIDGKRASRAAVQAMSEVEGGAEYDAENANLSE